MTERPTLPNRGRLRWRCRRGARELELILLRYLEQSYEAAVPATRAAFEHLLEAADPDLLDWLSGRALPTDPDIVALLPELRRGTSAPPGTPA